MPEGQMRGGANAAEQFCPSSGAARHLLPVNGEKDHIPSSFGMISLRNNCNERSASAKLIVPKNRYATR